MASKEDKDNKPVHNDPATAPDPDEDDLDDLDEMLDDFASTSVQDPAKTPDPTTAFTTTAPDASGPGRPATTAASEAPMAGPDLGGLNEDDFASQLQAGFAEMMKDLETNPEMAKQFEELMSQFGGPAGGMPGAAGAAPPTAAASSAAHTSAAATTAGGGGGAASKGAAAKPKPTPATAPSTSTSASASTAAPKAGEENFQDTIRRTMERMKASDSSAATAGAGAGDDDMMASLLRELGSMEGGAGGDDSFSKMLLGMMEQLTNKEILYEPMKELDTKFPGWMEKNGAELKKEDRDRYETQQVLVKEIVGRFEKAGYSDGNTADREFVVERMQKMQAAGAPPPDLVGDVNAAEELFGGAGGDAGCPQQ